MTAAGGRLAMLVLNDMRLDSRVRREAASLAAAGYDVTVHAVATDATRDRAYEAVDGYVIRRHPMLSRPHPDSVTAGSAGSRTATTAVRLTAARAFASTRPLLGGALHFTLNWQLRWSRWGRRVADVAEPADVWHAHDLPTLPAALECARRHGGQVVYDSHELYVDAGATARLPSLVRRALLRRERQWAERADAVITVNAAVAAVLRDRLGREDVTVVRNCAEPPVGASPLRESIGLHAETPLLLYHGSITIGRGLEALIDAMRLPSLTDAHLVLMGYGPLRPALQAHAAASPASDRIHFLAPVAPEAVTTWVSGADVAVMPIEPTTLNHRLSTPNKLFEAIAAGVPVVGPDFEGFRRVVRDAPWGPIGVLHANHAPASIAAAAGELIGLSPSERTEMRDRCRTATATELRWSIEVERLREVYAGLALAAARVEPSFAPLGVAPPATLRDAE